MFSRKKKDKKKSDGNEGSNVSEPSHVQPLTKEELKKLEQTRNKLFSFDNKNQLETSSSTLNSDGMQRPSEIADVVPPPIPRRAKPKPPPRPPTEVLMAASSKNVNSVDVEDEAPQYAPPLPPRNGHVSNGIDEPQPPTMTNMEYISPMIRYTRMSSTGAPLSPASTSSGGDPETEFGYQPLKSLALPGVHLPALTPVSMIERTVHLNRGSDGSFGVSLRRANLVDSFAEQADESRTVIFAEPMSRQTGMPTKRQLETSVQPGDMLIAVNGTNVEGMSREHVVKLIKDSGDSLELRVRPTPELCELLMAAGHSVTDDTEQDREMYLDAKARSIKQTSSLDVQTGGSSQTDGSSERVWLMHKAGYAAATVVNQADQSDNKMKIRLEDNQQVMTVDADDVDKANPESLDRVADSVSLLYLNECSVLHLLRQRYGCNLMYTNAGTNCTLSVNPIIPSTMYHHKFIDVFKGGSRDSVPAHIYGVGQHLYRQTQCTGRSQACVFNGRSASGKTTQAKHLLTYLCLVAGSHNKHLTVDRINAVYSVLESFGNASTSLNRNASRFATLFTVDFDHMSQISAASVQALLLETPRVLKRPDGERNFHVFHYLWRCQDKAVRQAVQLDSCEPTDVRCLVPSIADESADADVVCFGHLQSAFQTLAFSETEINIIWAVLGAIFHLVNARATTGTLASQSSFVNTQSAHVAADLLGITYEQLYKSIFQSGSAAAAAKSGSKKSDTGSPSSRAASKVPFRFRLQPESSGRTQVTDRVGEGADALAAFCTGLYQQLFNLVVSLINRSLSSNYRTVTSIMVVDCPGFQNVCSLKSSPTKSSPSGRNSDAGKRSANLSDLCFNYVNERLANLFYQCCFSSQMELYKHEQVEVELEEPTVSPEDMVNTLDKPSKQDLIHSANIQVRSQERRGLLWLLDEESIFPGATDESFLERVFVHYGASQDRPASNLLRKSSQYNHFALRHLLGSNVVHYSVSGWIKQAQDNPVQRAVLPLLQDSNKNEISELFVRLRGGMLAGFATTGAEATTTSTRRATTVLKALNNPQLLKRKSYCAMTKVQMDCICETVRRVGRVHFVQCFVPDSNPNVATTMKATNPLAASDTQVVHVPQLDVQVLRSQLRGSQIVDASRFNKIGYPERMPYAEFFRRFGCLKENDREHNGGVASMLNYRQAVLDLLNHIEVEPSRYRLGLSQLFLRSDLLAQLEMKRNLTLAGVVVGLQALCRSFLAKRDVHRRQIQEHAIKCIQKNINKYMKVKEWHWWRLYTKVLPLLSVMKSDGQIRVQDDELQNLRVRYAALEKNCAELRLRNDKLDVKLSEMSGELAEERQAAQQATEALASENASSVRLAAELNDLRKQYDQMKSASDELELKCLQYDNESHRLALQDEQDLEIVNGDVRSRIIELKQRVEALSQHNEQIKNDQTEKANTKVASIQKKLVDAQKQNEDLNENLQTQRRRAQKTADELQDVKMHVDKLIARNNELEKKQRRFDSELNAAKEEAAACRQQRDKYIRENEEALAKLYLVQQQLRDVEDDCDSQRRQVDQAHKEINEIQQSASSEIENELITLRRTKQELEKKLADQEAELDDQAGQIQQLESSQTRLQMASQRDNQVSAKELEAKDQELEELRASGQRLRRALEQQLEDEQEEKAAIARERRELEIRLQEANSRELVRDESYEAQLKRDLRRTKALLKDAQAMVQQQRSQSGSRSLVKQLQNQLEDAEAGRLAAIKARGRTEEELSEIRSQLEQQTAAKSGLEDRVMNLLKEKNTLSQQVEEHSEEWQELLKKYKAQVQQTSVDAITMNDQQQQIADLEREIERLKEQASEAQQRSQWQQVHMVDRHKLHLADSRIREIENRADLAEAGKARVEAQLAQMQASIDELRNELSNAKNAEDRVAAMQRRAKEDSSRQAEQLADAIKREADAQQKAHELQCALERTEQEHAATMSDLKLALRRVETLQYALRDELELDDDDDDDDQAHVNGHHDSSISDSNVTSPLPASTIHSGDMPDRPDSKWSDLSPSHPIARPRATSTPSVDAQ